MVTKWEYFFIFIFSIGIGKDIKILKSSHQLSLIYLFQRMIIFSMLDSYRHIKIWLRCNLYSIWLYQFYPTQAYCLWYILCLISGHSLFRMYLSPSVHSSLPSSTREVLAEHGKAVNYYKLLISGFFIIIFIPWFRKF